MKIELKECRVNGFNFVNTPNSEYLYIKGKNDIGLTAILDLCTDVETDNTGLPKIDLLGQLYNELFPPNIDGPLKDEPFNVTIIIERPARAIRAKNVLTSDTFPVGEQNGN